MCDYFWKSFRKQSIQTLYRRGFFLDSAVDIKLNGAT